ncbi:hypothetical protein [Butyrivibrio sp. NC2007]|uniref:hypothetical protein n=1 Tax=Butyrivibrio sp. NC2007 TaxID=1280683 RepID=UPI0003B5724A|nr:hypothetical protein [Butyrivibrio sp. NC2007]
MAKKTLIIEPGGGLGNRLLTISSAYQLAKDCGITDIRLLWRNNNECGCDYEDVLSGLPLETRIKTMHFGKDSYRALLKKGKFFSVLNKFIHMLFYRGFRIWSKTVQLPTYQNMSGDEQKALRKWVLEHRRKYIYIEAYYSFYGTLDMSGISFNREIVSRCEDYRKKIGVYDAMHIRRTDNVEAIANSPTELFYDKIEELNNKKIYVATDDSEILGDLMTKYPDRIYSEANSTVSRMSSEGMRFALYEMLILSGAETLYASYGSTFTVIANAIGHNKMIIVSK